LLASQDSDLIMIIHDTFELLQDDTTHEVRQMIIQSVSIAFQRVNLAAFAFCDDCRVIVACNRRSHIDPTAMHCAERAALIRRLASELPNDALQFVNGLRASARSI
jgi:hypothetical protein